MKTSEVHKFAGLLTGLFMSCLSLPELTLDDPAFREETIRRVIQGEHFAIDSDDFIEIERLLRDEESAESRLAGVILASELKGSEEFNELVVLLALDEDKEVSSRALWEIERNLQKYRGEVMKLIKSQNEQLRRQGLWIVGNTNFPEAREIYAGSFGDGSKIVRDEASIQFYMSTDREDARLRELARSPFPTTAATAYTTLARYRNVADLPLIISAIDSDTMELRLAARQSVFRFGELSLPLLHTLAVDADNNEIKRMAVLELIQAIGSDKSLSSLFNLLEDDNEKIVARAQSILKGHSVQDTSTLEAVFQSSNPEVRFQIITMLGNMEGSESRETVVRLLENWPVENLESFLTALPREMDDFVLRHLVAEGDEPAALIALKRMLDNRADSWIVLNDDGEVNYRAIRLMIKSSSLDEMRGYLNLELPRVPRLWKESLILLKQVWDLSDEFLALEKKIIEDRNSYIYARRLRELYLISSREVLERSFVDIHAYFRNGDPASLARSEENRRLSRQFEVQAGEQMALIESMDEQTRARGEEQFRRFREIRDIIVQAWKICPRELRGFFSRIYGEAGLDAEKTAREYDFQINW